LSVIAIKDKYLKNVNDVRELYRVINGYSDLMQKNKAEKDTAYRHLIVYIVVENKDGEILTYQRKSGNETRLHGHKSLGVGGHVEDTDLLYTDRRGLKKMHNKRVSAIEKARVRELIEELGLSEDEINSCKSEKIGFIKIDELPVDSVHLGIVFKIKLKKDMKINQNHELHNMEFKKIEDLEKEIDSYESWSKYVFWRLLK
jgi:predicted NUDIX family phosphoesterase